ncbi:MAG: ankyrin repeat domain-containing protein [Micavibrio sp.]|nr:ankyrin repeat domain-containing protein [Micavibrio sp.]
MKQNFNGLQPNPRIPETPDANGMTLLMEAARQNLLAKITECVGMKHNINAVDNAGNNALMHAVVNDSEEAACLLLHHGIAPDCAAKTGETPLMEACRRQMDTIVERIAASGKGLDLQEKVEGRTALMLAIEAGDGWAACRLASAGADTATLRDKKGDTAESLARLRLKPQDLIAFEKTVAKHKAAAAADKKQRLAETVTGATILQRGIKPLRTLRFGGGHGPNAAPAF